MIDKLWKEYEKTRKRELRNEIAQYYLPMVKSALRCWADSSEWEDLVSEGFVALVGAVERFDPTKNIKFETYAHYRIKGAVADYLRSLDWAPRSMRRKIKEVQTAGEKLDKTLGRGHTQYELSEAVGKEIDEILNHAHSLKRLSLDNGYEPRMKMGKVWEETGIAHLALNGLTELEKTVVQAHLDGAKIKEIATDLSVSAGMVSNVKKRALAKMRKELKFYSCQ
jgi:RNA polymerase sigma factor for flagellar operon FliA